MELDSIAKQLNKKFSEPLPEFYLRRIIFWNDEDGDFKDSIEDLKLDNAKIVVLKENNNFAVKRLLSSEDLSSNYLVYNPFATDMEDDWLLDIKLFSESFRADQLSMWMQEMNIDPIPEVRESLKSYKQYLNAAPRRKMLAQFGPEITTEQKLHMAILASVLRTRMNPKEIIKSVMRAGDDIDNKAKADLLTYGAAGRFWQLVNKAAGFNSDKDVNHMDTHIVLSAASQTLPDKVLSGLETRYSTVHAPFCYDLVFEWIHSDTKDEIIETLRKTEKGLKLTDRFDSFEIEDLVDTEVFPCIDEVILNKLMRKIIDHTISADSIISIAEKRRTMAWHEEVEDYYTGLYWAAKMLQFMEAHAGGFHLTEADKIWKAYCDDYYLMDTYYRQFYLAFNKCISSSHPSLDDDFKNVASEIEKLYKNWYLSGLSQNWTATVESDLKDVGYVPKIELQTNFYNKYVRNEGNKIFVIISDALRYEVATSLADQLRIETKSDVKLESIQAQFPTITKFGMAALLPHNKLTLEEKAGGLKILADGKSTDSGYRKSVLQTTNPSSVVTKYTDLLPMKKEDRRNLIKGAEVVYIYHDVIDKTGHSNEQELFVACDKAINEIKNLIRIVTGELNGLSIVVTSDHGFIYTYEPLNEDDKLDKSEFKKDIIEQDRRHVITDMEAHPDFLIPVKGFYNDNGYQAFSPRENIRIKGAGGLNFVHGGASLQEMVVPVIQYKYLRSGYKSYEQHRDKYDSKPVTIALLSANRKISNMIFNLSFYQKESVEGVYVPCTYRLFLVDGAGNTISDVQKIVADRASKDVKEREFRCTFNLKQQAYNNHETYYLMIQDEEGLQIPVKEEMQIDIAMSFDDFNFFGD